MTYADPDKLPSEPNKVGHIHIHPIAEDVEFSYSYKKKWETSASTVVNGKLYAGPSGDDRAEAGKNSGGVRNVVVDAKHVYLINRRFDQQIKIDRR